MSLFLIDADREWRERQSQVLTVARELRKKGLGAYLVVEPGSEILRRASDEGLPVLPVKMHGRMAWLVRRTLVREMKDYGCKLVHVHETFGAQLGLAAAAAAFVPLRVLSRPADSSPLEGKLPLASVDAVIAGSEPVKSALIRGGVPAASGEVIPPGVDFSAFTTQPREDLVRQELGLAAEDFLVGAVLPLEDERGLQALLEASALVGAQTPKIKIVVLGEGSLRLDADQEGGLPAMDGIRYYLGSGARTPKILASLDMFVVFSHLDGLGGHLIEAMASGLPVAAVDVGAARDLIIHRESGLLIPARNAKALADAILKIGFDRNLAARLGAKGKDTVLEKYSTEAMARRVIGVYEYRAHRKGLKLG
ncbi:MAG TPA: glycosyltransferase family 4 protein [Candidatus Bathyarchaeia archaeon]|nr:glycosyltransferase family 4 protein [Candidatus Bathyarchaeia archaeon]